MRAWHVVVDVVVRGERGAGHRLMRMRCVIVVNPLGCKCASCMRDVGNEAIGCDECDGWVHNSEMCSSLTQDVLDTITRYSGGGINFVCTKCRVETSSGKAKSLDSPDSPLRVC